MNKIVAANLIMAVAFVSIASYLYIENRRVGKELALIRQSQAQLMQQIQVIQSQLPNLGRPMASISAVCDREFPSGYYRLSTNTSYGPSHSGEYDIHHVSILLSEWNVNVGVRMNRFSIPTDFYLDYDSDGRIDTALAARFVREIPIAGNTIADRMLADSTVHQNLYGVFSCEWRNAEFTSSDDMNAKVSGSPNMLWTTVQEESDSLVKWIDEL